MGRNTKEKKKEATNISLKKEGRNPKGKRKKEATSNSLKS